MLGYINSNNGSSTAINVYGWTNVGEVDYSILGDIDISKGVFSSNEMAISIG